MPRMRLRVDLLPRPPYPDVAIVVDVLRATTSVSILLARGAREVWVTGSFHSARKLAEPGDLLVGEHEGIPPEGFHHGVSPQGLLSLDLTGQRVIYAGGNLPRALAQVAGAPKVFLGAFRNAGAVSKAALASARAEIALVCAGLEGSEALDDTLAAGFLAKLIQRRSQETVELADAARMAIALLAAYPDPQEALFQSGAGKLLAKIGCGEDLAYASLISQDRVVPELAEYLGQGPSARYRFMPWNGLES